jgi:diketogulonate reductase-like aldo/keto reductase
MYLTAVTQNHMEQNMDALQVRLTAADIEEIEDGFAQIQVRSHPQVSG